MYKPAPKKAIVSEWNAHYNHTNAQGLYRASQPIYGFRADPPRNGLVINYIRAYQILRAVSRFPHPQSLLDAGGGEGYTAFLIQSFFQINHIQTIDMSPLACKRARDIFHFSSQAQDLTKLSFPDNSFDLVVCSETIEHIADYHTVLEHLIRVAKYGVIITIPHESPRLVSRSRAQGVPGDHINSFHRHSFDHLLRPGLHLEVSTMISPLLYIPSTLVDASPRRYNQFYARKRIPPFVVNAYNQLTPIFQHFFTARNAASLVYLDDWCCRHLPWYGGIVLTFAKGTKLSDPQPVSVAKIMNTKVPFFHLKSGRFRDDLKPPVSFDS